MGGGKIGKIPVRIRKMKKLIFLILMLLIFFYCRPKQEKVERYMEDGVEVIVNHLEPYKIKGEPGSLHLEEEFIIDFEGDDIAEIGMVSIAGFDVDSEGNIYFWSYSSSEDFIYKFDIKGKFTSSFGHQGQGPGEFQRLFHLMINEKDEIVASDPGKKKIIVLKTNGNLIREIPIAPNHGMTTLLENENILAMKSVFNPEGGFTETPIVICNKDLEDIKMLHKGQKIPNWIRAKKINGLHTSPNHFPWSISRRHIYVGNEEKGYEILVYDFEGTLLKKIRKKYSPVEVPQRIKEKVFKVFDNHPVAKQINIRDKFYFPDNMPPFQYFFTDNVGRLYVMTYEKGEKPKEYIYDIFSQEGFFITGTSLDNSGDTTIAIWGGPFEIRAKNNRLYCLREKESGYKELVVYKMRWE